jgi:hypothetical protein
MGDETQVIELGERVARIARELNIETIVIGAYAMAIHDYVRGSVDFDLGTRVDLDELYRLKRAIEATELSVRMNSPDEHDDLGGKLIIWNRVDEEGDPLEPVEVVNFLNPLRPRRNPAAEAIKNAIELEGKPALRYPLLADLVALKLDAGGPRDHADVIELLRQNPAADVEAIRATCKKYGLDKIDELIEHAKSGRR